MCSPGWPLVVLAIRALHQAVRRYRAAALRSPRLDRGDTGRAYVSLDGPTAVNLAVVLGRPADDGGLTWFGVPLFATGVRHVAAAAGRAAA